MRPWVGHAHRANPATSTSGDAGFTVLECLVAFVVLSIVGTASVYAVVEATQTDNSSSNRAVAAALAQRDQNAAQTLRYPAYPAAVAATNIKVGTTTYTITRTVTNACPSTPNYTTNPYMTVSSAVTWPPGGTTHQIVMAQELAC